MEKKILKFSASWCEPCKMLTKQLEGVDLGVVVEEVDIDQNMDRAAEFQIRGVPTLVLLEDGVEVNRIVGGTNVTGIREKFGLSST